jgi:hypothetical protein
VGNRLAISIKAGGAYAVTVFAIGCLLGAIRIMLVAPRVGATTAVLVETPFILAASWYVSGIWMRRLAVSAEVDTRVLAGAVAFVTLMTLEVALSTTLFHRSMGEYWAGLRSPPGAIGFAGQVCFATFPLLNAIAARRSMPSGRAL